MTNSIPLPDAPAPGDHRRRPAMRNKVLLAVALLTAICSVLLLQNSGKDGHPAGKGVSNGVTTTDITEAAAYAATSAGTIAIQNYAFSPAAVTVPLGSTVTWVNQDAVPHTVTSTSGPASFDSGQMTSGASYSATFKTAGTYKYYCADHPQMTATITVTGGTPPPSTVPSTTAHGTTPPPTTHGTTPPTTHGTTPPSATATSATTPPAPSATPSGSMSMPVPSAPGGSSAGQCASVSQVLLPLLTHLDTTHLGESPGQQVSDLTNLNQYVLAHTTLVANMLTPLLGVTTTSTDGLLSPLLAHLNATHLGESPGQQVNDLMNLDQYVLAHTTLIETMITPTEGALTGSC